MSIPHDAMMLAMELHKDQKRKYTHEPYWKHLAEVAGIVATVEEFYGQLGDVAVATAWLHDAVEDQELNPKYLKRYFGPEIEMGVMLLSDLEEGNRATRKRLSRERLSASPGWVQTIKCADLISNTSSIVMHDPDFAKVYLEEKRLLLDVMSEANPQLRQLAYSML